jgi:23S rRNA (cytosine1962-C5)-methyltransferase
LPLSKVKQIVKKIFLKQKKEAAVRRYHPWVFSGAVHHMEAMPEDGEVVEVCSQKGAYLATGHYQDGSICTRIFTFEQQEVDQVFWNKKIRNAFEYRQLLGLPHPPITNCYRLVHAEGDGLPGLIIDIYGDTAVVQCHSIGMHKNIHQIAEALQKTLGDQLAAIYDKSKESLPSNYAAKVENGYLWGEKTAGIVTENEVLFSVDWEGGQKTGFFLDQRENRQLLRQYSKGKKILNTFAYSGGFSMYALAAHAQQVDSVDISQTAVDLIEKNIQLNGFQEKEHAAFKADVLPFLQKSEPNQYDLIILDPPAYAKSLKKRHNAVQGYKRLNKVALEKIKRGGILMTFSCSQVVDKKLFYNTIVAAAHEAGRHVKLMHQLSQPADHPVSLFHPEGEYLKGLVLYIEK